MFVRFGDGLAALTVLVGVNLWALPTASYFAINVGLVLVWLALAVVVIREYRRLSGADDGDGGEAEAHAPARHGAT